MTKDGEHFFMNLFAICRSSLVKYLDLLSIFLRSLFVLLLLTWQYVTYIFLKIYSLILVGRVRGRENLKQTPCWVGSLMRGSIPGHKSRLEPKSRVGCSRTEPLRYPQLRSAAWQLLRTSTSCFLHLESRDNSNHFPEIFQALSTEYF